jgi:hypothetical protein
MTNLNRLAKLTDTYMVALAIVLLALPSLVTIVQYGYSESEVTTSGDITILSSSSFTDDIGYYHVVGEVKNNSPKDSMNYVKIVSTFYDDTKRVIGSDFTFTDVDVLRPAEKSSFEIILNDAAQSQKVSSYKLSTSGDKTEPLPASLKLSAGDSHLDDIGYLHVVGEITNQGSQKATYVKVSGAFYNSSNAVVATDYTFTDPKDLESGQTAPFEIIVNAPTVNKITSASLNVDSSQYSSINNQTVQVVQNVNSSPSSSQQPQYSPQQQQQPYLYPPSNPNTQPSYPPHMSSQPIILSQNAYTDNTGTVHIVGEVMNQSPAIAHDSTTTGTFASPSTTGSYPYSFPATPGIACPPGYNRSTDGSLCVLY